MKVTPIILIVAMLTVTGCANTNKNNADMSLDQRQVRTQNLDQQEGASMAASTISPLTY